MIKNLGLPDKVHAIVRFSRVCTNWNVIIIDYFKFFLRLKNPGFRTLIFKNGTQLKVSRKCRSEPADVGFIADIWFNKVCTPPGLEIENGDTVVDIGAHKGYFSIFAALQTGAKGRVYSLEPFPATFSILEENMALNNLKDNIKPINLGVAGEKGAKKFYISATSGTHSICENAGMFVEINCVTLEDVYILGGIDRCDFLKIDCEGAEYEILLGTSETILGRVNKISIECHKHEHHSQKELEQFLTSKGFLLIPTTKSKSTIYARKYPTPNHN